mgnify:CR=1 FL=1
MKYYVEGRVFESQEEALKYEDELNQKKQKENELREQKKARIDEINQKEKELKQLINKYYDDYGIKSGLTSWIDFFI